MPTPQQISDGAVDIAAADREATNAWSEIAAHSLHWHHSELDAWLSRAQGQWHGWSASSLAAVSAGCFQPWRAGVCDATEAPFVRWFPGAATNAAFNELDRHVFAVSSAQASMAAEDANTPRAAAVTAPSATGRP